MNENLTGTLEAFGRLLKAMQQLRGENGCQWNKAQSFFTLKTFLMEEAYEVLDALPVAESQPLPSANALCEELGDLLLQIVFLGSVAQQAHYFSMHQIIDGIYDKIVRRHPHVFDPAFREKAAGLNAAQVARLWEEIKKKEKAKNPQIQGALSGVPRSMPALTRADTLGKKAHHNGFDWPDLSGVLAKLHEEMAEFGEALRHHTATPDKKSHLDLEGELGDVLFTLAQISRFLNLSAENALHGSCEKFMRRFEEMENGARLEGKAWGTLTMAQKEDLWNRAKQTLSPKTNAAANLAGVNDKPELKS